MACQCKCRGAVRARPCSAPTVTNTLSEMSPKAVLEKLLHDTEMIEYVLHRVESNNISTSSNALHHADLSCKTGAYGSAKDDIAQVSRLFPPYTKPVQILEM